MFYNLCAFYIWLKAGEQASSDFIVPVLHVLWRICKTRINLSLKNYHLPLPHYSLVHSKFENHFCRKMDFLTVQGYILFIHQHQGKLYHFFFLPPLVCFVCQWQNSASRQHLHENSFSFESLLSAQLSSIICCSLLILDFT